MSAYDGESARSARRGPAPARDESRGSAPERRVGDGPPLAADVWTLSSYDEVSRAAIDAQRFSCGETNGAARRSVNVLVGIDGPEHTRIRRALGRALSGVWVDSRAARIDRIVSAVMSGFLQRGGDEVVSAVAEPIASGVLSDLLGLDPAAVAARRSGRGLWPDARRAWRAFFLEAIGRQLEEPTEDLIGRLVRPAAGSDRLTEDELLSLLGLLMAAGADSTRDLVANLLAELAEHPEQYERLAADRALAGSAVEEILRYCSPVQAVFRTVTSDLWRDDGMVPAGARARLLFGAANRDAERWPEAASLDIGRYAAGGGAARRHIAFGIGPHACPGAQIARRVARGVLGELLERDVRLVREGPIERRRNPSFGSLLSLPLRVNTGGEHG